MKHRNQTPSLFGIGAIYVAAAVIATVATLPAAAQQAGNKDQGFRLAEIWCNGCHMVRSERAGEDREAYIGPAPAFMDIAGISEPRFWAALTRPHPLQLMPQFTGLRGEDIADILAYVRSLR